MTQVIPFRPTEKTLAIVENYMKEHNIKSRSKAVNAVLEQFQQPMPEGYTGQLISCPLRPAIFCQDCPFDFDKYMHVKGLVDSSVCKTCQKYPCESWEQIESERRIT